METKKAGEKTPKTNLISRDVAVNDLNKWFDLLEVPEDDRIDINEEDGEKAKDDPMREKVIKTIMTGRLCLNDEGLMQYTLKHPIRKQESKEIVLATLTFGLRYREHELESNMKGVSPKDFLPFTRAYIATITGVSKSLLGKLYNADSTALQAVYTLFTRGDA